MTQQIFKATSVRDKLTATETSTSSPDAEIAQSLILNENNLTNNAASAGDNTEEQEDENEEIDEDKQALKLKIERLSRIRQEIKESKITVKQAIEQLKAEELNQLDIDEIESEEDAQYAAQPSKSKEKSSEQPVLSAQLGYMTKVNGSVIIRLG